MENYILPFIGINDTLDEKNLIGTAFIVKPNLLITVGHNIKSKENKDFKNYGVVYEDKIHILNNPVIIEYDYKFIIDGNCIDLAIYKLEHNYNEAFELKKHNSKENLVYDILGYCIESENLNYTPDKRKITISNPDYSFKNFPDEQGKARLSKYINCLNFNEKIITGFSGCPVYNGKSVYGMIVYGPENSCYGIPKSMDFGVTAIKSEFIIETIKNNL